jgi:hypothetical protein
MASRTKQVPQKWTRLSPGDRALIVTLVSPSGPFPDVTEAKRRYPGATEGTYLASYLNELSARPETLKAFTDLVSPLMQFQQRIKQNMTNQRTAGTGGPSPERNLLKAYASLKQKIDRQGLARLTKDGLLVPPATAEGKAALAVLLLYDELRLPRLRQCLRCGDWLYAHLERQVFCSDAKKNCQWKHKHSPEWRKMYRERNRKHQRKYRERNPGRKG